MKCTKSISILGTGSDVGKSIVATALCRIIANKDKLVVPFKAQNMSNNSFVTKEGGEMGRAQVVQAEAANVEPHTDMNPVLLKPSADNTSQVILQGKAIGSKNSAEYWNDTNYLFNKAFESFERLKEKSEFIVMEGAGSCAEVNLRNRDFVNFRMAHKANADVILVADIDRGGVFAQIIGTLNIIPPEDCQIIKGIIINKFRGDATLFDDGIKYIEEQTGIPVLGLIPYFYNIDIDSEDGVVLDARVKSEQTFDKSIIKIGVFKLPHISNFTDISPLQRDSSIELTYLYKPRNLNNFDAVIIPGTKNTRFDIDWMRKQGWESVLKTYANNGGNIIGICGGFQMLGKSIADPLGIEGKPGSSVGFNFLEMETILSEEKSLLQIEAIHIESGKVVKGYEIHNGKTFIGKNCEQIISVKKKSSKTVSNLDGAKNKKGNIWGSYIHGLFDENEFRKSILQSIKPNAQIIDNASSENTITEFKNKQYNKLAAHYTKHLNMSLINKILDRK